MVNYPKESCDAPYWFLTVTENTPIFFLSFFFLTKLKWNPSLEPRSYLDHTNPVDFSPSFTHIFRSITSACGHRWKCQLPLNILADPLSISRPRESYSHLPLTLFSFLWPASNSVFCCLFFFFLFFLYLLCTCPSY